MKVLKENVTIDELVKENLLVEGGIIYIFISDKIMDISLKKVVNNDGFYTLTNSDIIPYSRPISYLYSDKIGKKAIENIVGDVREVKEFEDANMNLLTYDISLYKTAIPKSYNLGKVLLNNANTSQEVISKYFSNGVILPNGLSLIDDFSIYLDFSINEIYRINRLIGKEYEKLTKAREKEVLKKVMNIIGNSGFIYYGGDSEFRKADVKALKEHYEIIGDIRVEKSNLEKGIPAKYILYLIKRGVKNPRIFIHKKHRGYILGKDGIRLKSKAENLGVPLIKLINIKD